MYRGGSRPYPVAGAVATRRVEIPPVSSLNNVLGPVQRAQINAIGEARMLESIRAAYVDGATLADPEAGADAAEPPSLLFVSGQCAELKGDQAVAVGLALANRRKIRVWHPLALPYQSCSKGQMCLCRSDLRKATTPALKSADPRA